MYSEKREKRNYQEHEKASFFHLSEFQNSFFSLLLRKRLICFPCGLLLLCCSCRKTFEQPFTDVLRCSSKSCHIHRKTLVLEILFNKLYQKEAPTQVFLCECYEMFKYSFSYRNICEYEFFEYYAMLSFFFRSVLQAMAKNNPTKKQIEAKILKRH